MRKQMHSNQFGRNPLYKWVYLLVFMCILDCTKATGSHNQSSDALLQHHHRHRRAPGDVDNLQALARITTGIALEIGLMDGTIPPDDVIAELLQIGTVKTNDFIGLQKDVITGALTELQRLPVSDQGTKDVEDRLIYLDSLMLTSGFMKNFSKFPGRDEYKTALKDVEELANLPNVNYAALKSDVDMLAPHLQVFEVAPSDLNDQQVLDIDADLKSVKNMIGKVEAAVKLLKPLVPMLTKAKKLLDHADFYKILSKEKTIRDELTSIPFDPFYDNLKAHFNTIETSRPNFVASKPSFDTLRLLFASRDSLAQPSFQYTYGLPNGYSDLEELIKDVKNPWIESRLTNKTVVFSSLEKAFTPLTLSANNLRKVVESWKPMSDPVSRKPIQSVLDAHSSTFDLKGDLQHILKTLDELKNCGTVKVPSSGDFGKIKTIIQKITKLNNEMAQLPSFDYAAELEDLKPVKDILSPTGNVDKTVATQIVQKLKALPLFQKLTEGLKRLQSDLDTVPNLAPQLASQVNEIKQGFPYIKQYHDDVNQDHYIAFFGCLQVVGSKSATAANAIKLLQKTQLDTKVTTEAKNLIEKIIDSGSDLTVARDQMKGVKKATDREMLELKSSFPNSDSLETSQSLGQAVHGLLAIQAAHNKRKELDPLLNDIPKILTGSKGLSKEDQTSLAHLNKLKKTFDDIEAFQKKLNAINAQRKKRAAHFKSSENLFKEAETVSGFAEDLDKIKKALSALKNQNASLMDKLKTLNLDFTTFKTSFTEAQTSLGTVDAFFLEYTKQMSNPPPPPTAPIISNQNPNPTPRPIPVLDASPESTTEAGSKIWNHIMAYLALYIFIVLIVIAAISIIVYCLVLHFCCCCPDPDPEPVDRDLESGTNGDHSKVEGTKTAEEMVKLKDAAKEKDEEIKKRDEQLKEKEKQLKEADKAKEIADEKAKVADKKEKEVDKKEKEVDKKKEEVDKKKEEVDQKEKEAKEANENAEQKLKEAELVDEDANEKLQKADEKNEFADEKLGKAEEMQVRAVKRIDAAHKLQDNLERKIQVVSATAAMTAKKAEEDKQRVMGQLEVANRDLKQLKKNEGVEEGEVLEKKTQPSFKIPDLSLPRTTVQAMTFQLRNLKVGITAKQWATGIMNIEPWQKNLGGDDYHFHRRERRYTGVICNRKFRVTLKGFENDFINANFIDIEIGGRPKRITMAQAPLNGTEPCGKSGLKMLSTLEKHFAMIVQGNIGIVLKLCQWVEGEDRTEKCAVYYSETLGESKKFGRFLVTTLHINNSLNEFSSPELFVLYSLSVLDTTTEATHMVDVLSFSGWPDFGVPIDPRPAVEMIYFANNKYPNNQLVHCSAGIGRTGTLVAISYGMEEASNEHPLNLTELIAEIRKHRYGAVQDESQALYIALCIEKHIMMYYGEGSTREYIVLEYYHKRMAEKAYDKFEELKEKAKKEFLDKDYEDLLAALEPVDGKKGKKKKVGKPKDPKSKANKSEKPKSKSVKSKKAKAKKEAEEKEKKAGKSKDSKSKQSSAMSKDSKNISKSNNKSEKPKSKSAKSEKAKAKSKNNTKSEKAKSNKSDKKAKKVVKKPIKKTK